ncbi:Similar to resilin: Pro-resilin (Drosophila melanogaster) [Cotesia congregata]|uniref:Similar to resilin: Pro-resilin (Drosophila melanogaster) n=1 Tax=Cotesia congregata TaxID=51543 RepID=A0A8J2HDD8_COTCN|nr:Similar to resilin: Pro-resilin (Drosophila melanogaster) [Cotesia congregata]
MTYLLQLTGRILLALCCVRTATVYAGLLPEAVSNGYQYNRPTAPGTTTFDEGAFTDPTGVGDYSNRGNNGYPRDSPSERLTLPPFTTTKTTPTINFASGSDSDGDSDSGNFSDSATGSVNALEFGRRSGNNYRGEPGFKNDFSRGIGYNQPTRANTFDLPNGYNDIPSYQGTRNFPPPLPIPSGNNEITDPYRNQNNLNDNRPRPYNFQYRVFDPPSGNDYGQQESSDGNVVRGEYRVLLPDSRTQIVKYTADDANGYNADVQYEGQVQYPNGFFPGTGTGTGIGTGSFPDTSVGYKFPGSDSEGPYQPIDFSSVTPYQGRGVPGDIRGGNPRVDGIREGGRGRGGIGGGVVASGGGGAGGSGYNRGPTGNNGIFSSTGGGGIRGIGGVGSVAVGAGPGNQYLPPGGGFGK